MGLSTFTFLWDWLRQAFLLLLGALLLLLIVSAADGSPFWMRYAAKDVGLLLEASHIPEGEIRLDYRKLPGSYDYNATPTGLLLRSHGGREWRVRQRYGTTLDGRRVEQALLKDPERLRIATEGETIHLAGSGLAPPGCPAASRPREELLLRIEGEGPLDREPLERLAETFTPSRSPVPVTLALRHDETAGRILVAAEGRDEKWLAALLCRLAEHLEPLPVETLPPRSGEEERLTITHPSLPGFDGDRLAAALAAALSEVTR